MAVQSCHLDHRFQIKTHGSESQSHEEAACMHLFLAYATISYSELFIWMAALKFKNAVTQPP